MTTEFGTNTVLHGTKGHMFWNNIKVAGLQSVEIKLNPEWEPINQCGDTATYHAYNGYEVDGTFTYLKCDSTILKELWKAFETGKWPTITITTSVGQRGTNKQERISVTDIVVTELMLAKFEKKKYCEDTVPFKGGKFTVLETI